MGIPAGSLVGLRGRFRLWHRDPDGRLLWHRALANGVTVQGADYLNGVAFKGAAAVSSWRFLLISAAGYSAVDAADTHAAHPGWSEFASVASSNRPAWSPASPASGVLGTAASTVVTLTASGDVIGVGLASLAAAGSTDPAAFLYATAVAPLALAVVSGGTITVQYTLNALPVR